MFKDGYSYKGFMTGLVADMIIRAPFSKHIALFHAIERVYRATGDTHFWWSWVSVYREGWKIEFEGGGTGFEMWVDDNDGEFGYGHRKPTDAHYLWGLEIEWSDLEDLISPNGEYLPEPEPEYELVLRG